MKPGSIRVGQGFDVHPWSDDDTDVLVLGGVSIPGFPGLTGHSDSDVIAHACTDAVLGAVGLGDIGQLFPDTDQRLAGANSVGLLAEAISAVREAGWTVANIDCTIVLDAPKIAPLRAEMEANLAAAVGAPVAIKGKRTEGVTALAEGVQCFAVALLYKPEDEPPPDSDTNSGVGSETSTEDGA